MKNKKLLSSKLDHVNFSAKSVEETIQFYEELFDFQIVEKGSLVSGPYAIMKNGGSMICFSENNEKNAVPDKFNGALHINHFALSIDDEGEFEKRLELLKPARSIQDPVDYPFSTSWYVLDPNGHEIEVVKWHESQPKFPVSKL